MDLLVKRLMSCQPCAAKYEKKEFCPICKKVCHLCLAWTILLVGI